MRYTVNWTPLAQDQLAEIWIGARNREAVTAASARIDGALVESPQAKGRARSEGLWEFTEPPLRVLFSINESKAIVDVEAVKLVFGSTNGRLRV